MGIAVLVVLVGVLLCGKSAQEGSGGTVVNIRKAIFRRNKFHG